MYFLVTLSFSFSRVQSESTVDMRAIVFLSIVCGIAEASVDMTVSHATWMGDLSPYLSSYTLYNLTLPGTHDSLSFNSSDQVGNAVTPHSSTFGYLYSKKYLTESFARSVTESQTLSITSQLDSGVRFLDLRVTYRDGDWYGVHYLETQRSAGDYLNDIALWLRSYSSEVVIIFISSDGTTGGENHFLGVSSNKQRAFWSSINTTFGDMIASSDTYPISSTPLATLVQAGKQVILVVSGWSVMTDSDPLAYDSRSFFNLNSPNTDSPLSAIRQHAGLNKLPLRDGGRFWLDSYAAVIPGAAVDAAMAAQFKLSRFLLGSWSAQKCSIVIGIPGSDYCPSSIDEYSRLTNYYNQRVIEKTLTTLGSDLPQIVTFSRLLDGGLIATDRAERSTFSYAIVDKILLRNLQRLCTQDACTSATESLVERVRRTGPFRQWEDSAFGRTS